MKEIIEVYAKDLSKTSKTTISTWCRKAIASGIDPNAEAHFYLRDNPEPELISGNIGETAKWTVKENSKVGPKFVKYEPFPSKLKAVS
jgi:hypothetical protein